MRANAHVLGGTRGKGSIWTCGCCRRGMLQAEELLGHACPAVPLLVVPRAARVYMGGGAFRACTPCIMPADGLVK